MFLCRHIRPSSSCVSLCQTDLFHYVIGYDQTPSPGVDGGVFSHWGKGYINDYPTGRLQRDASSVLDPPFSGLASA